MGVLSNHENQLEVVHSQSHIIELVHIGKEDDVLDCILYDLGVVRYSFTNQQAKKTSSNRRRRRRRWMSRHTLQLQKDSQPGFVIGRNLAHMRGKNRLDVFFQSAGFEEGTKRIADGVDLVGRDSRGYVFVRLFTIHGLGRVLRAIIITC